MAPARLPLTSTAHRVEMLCFGAAGVTAFAPLCMVFPSNQARLERQTTRWGPTWERNITMFKHPLERGIQRVAPPVERTVKAIDKALPLERIAQGGAHASRYALGHLFDVKKAP